MYYANDNIHIEDDDQCMTCEYVNKGIACPLLHALGLGVVTIEESLVVTNCGFYKKFKRHLKIVSAEE